MIRLPWFTAYYTCSSNIFIRQVISCAIILLSVIINQRSKRGLQAPNLPFIQEFSEYAVGQSIRSCKQKKLCELGTVSKLCK